jgi:lysozyme
MLRVTDKGLAELMSHEALVTAPYLDSEGVWTIGVGHTAAAGFPNPATMPKGVQRPVSEMVMLFRQDIAKYEADVRKAVKVDLAPHEFDALVSFHFNTGGIGRAKLTESLNRGDRRAAGNQFLNWVKPEVLRERRMKEMRLFTDGIYSNNGRVTVYPADERGRVLRMKGERVRVDTLMKPTAPPPPDHIPDIGKKVQPGFIARFFSALVARLLKRG